VPPFYKSCMDTFLDFQKRFPDADFLTLKTRDFYKLLIGKIVTKPNVERIFPLVNISQAWKDINSNFMEPNISTLSWKIVHQIVPVNYTWWKRNRRQSKYCNFCRNVETICHIFYECSTVRPLWNIVFTFISYYDQDIRLSEDIVLYNSLPVAKSPYHRQVCTYLLSCAKYCIWSSRNKAQYNNKRITADLLIMNFIYKLKFRITVDFLRLDRIKFTNYWAFSIFCSIDLNTNKLIFNITYNYVLHI